MTFPSGPARPGWPPRVTWPSTPRDRDRPWPGAAAGKCLQDRPPGGYSGRPGAHTERKCHSCRRVRLNPGSDPDRDDFGLPPVDVVIPDDARELDRDVQAYLRELRALRRRDRVSRLRGPLARDGMVLPLLAGCLILALVTSTLLIMFAADQTGMPELPGHAGTNSAAPRHPAAGQPAVGKIGGPLPSGQVVIGGKTVSLRTVTAAKAAMLTLIPPDCACASLLRQLGTRATQAHVAVYLVGTGAIMPQVSQLAARAGQSPARVADDT